MIWTDVTWILAAVAALVIVVAFIAILLGELRNGSDQTTPLLQRGQLPDNADLPPARRRDAMRGFRREPRL